MQIKSYAISYAKMQVVAGAEFRLLHSNEHESWHDDKQLFY